MSVILIKVYVTRKSLIPLNKIAKQYGGIAYLVGKFTQVNEIVNGFIKVETNENNVNVLYNIRRNIVLDMEEHTFVIISSTITNSVESN